MVQWSILTLSYLTRLRLKTHCIDLFICAAEFKITILNSIYNAINILLQFISCFCMYIDAH